MPRSTARTPHAGLAAMVALGAVALLAAALPVAGGRAALAAASSTTTTVAAPPAALTAARIAERSRAGVYFVSTAIAADISVPDFTLNQDLLISNTAGNPTCVAASAGGGATAATQCIVDKVLVPDLATYLVPGTPRRKRTTISFRGSGVAVAEGYVATNAHVVADDTEDITRDLVKSGAADIIAAEIKSFEGDTGGLPPASVKAFQDAYLSALVKGTKVSGITRSVRVLQSPSLAGPAMSKEGFAAEVVAEGKPYPGKDVALLKVAATGMSALPLGDEDALASGSQLLIIGFPANADIESGTSAGKLEPSLTQGLLSAKKPLEGGFTVLQTDAGGTSGGSSGGPVFNDRGEVVGLHTLASSEGGDFRYSMPISLVEELMAKAGATPAVTEPARLWDEALALVDERHLVAADAKLAELLVATPDRPYVTEKRATLATRIAAGEDVPIVIAAPPTDDGGSGALVGLAVGGASTIGLAALAVVVLRRRRGRGTAPLQPVGPPGAHQPMPQQPMPQGSMPQQPTAYQPTAYQPTAPYPSAPPAPPVAYPPPPSSAPAPAFSPPPSGYTPTHTPPAPPSAPPPGYQAPQQPYQPPPQR